MVVDASVLVALYVEEDASRAAKDALAADARGDVDLHAPELLTVEVANALWSRVRRGDLDAVDAMGAIRRVTASTDIELHPLHPLAPQALALALAHGLTSYDASYVACAVEVGGVVLTADRRLAKVAAEQGLPVASLDTWS